MAVVNKDSRFPLRYDDPYEEPPVSLASTPPADLSLRESDQATSNQHPTLSAVDDTVNIPDNRPPGDGASARRDMPPLSVASPSNDDDDDETFHSPSAEDPSAVPASPPPLVPRTVLENPSSPPPPLVPRSVPENPGSPPPPPVPRVAENPSAGNYDEPWDLTSRFRQLEEKFRAVPRLSPAVPAAVSRAHSEDTRVLADGYDRPWDLQPHRRDDRDDVGYDKPWDLKPHQKDVRASVAEDGEYDAPWDIKPRSVVEREVIAAKSAKDAAAERPTPGPRSVGPHSSESVVQQAESGRVVPQQYDQPWDQKQKELVGKVAGNRHTSL